MTLTVTKKMALEAMAVAVAEKGADYRYRSALGGSSPRCYYVRGNAPSCLVGTALHRLGVDIKTLSELDSLADTEISAPEVQSLLSREGYELADSAVWALDAAQEQQDRDQTWGRALGQARTA